MRFLRVIGHCHYWGVGVNVVKNQKFIEVVDLNERMLRQFVDKGITENLNVYCSFG